MNKTKFVSHKKLHNKWMEDPKYHYEYEKLEPEFQIAKTIIEARIKKKISQADFFKGKSKYIARLAKTPKEIEKIQDKDYVSLTVTKTEDINTHNKMFSIYLKKELSLSNLSEFCIEYTLRNLSKDRFSSFFAVEFNWSFMNKLFLKNRIYKNVETFPIRDEWTGIGLKYFFSDKVTLWTMPVYSINETDGGLAKTYQYLNMVAQKEIKLEPDESVSFNFLIKVD